MPDVVRTTDPDWEQRLIDALALGEPFVVACHADPMVRIREINGDRRAYEHLPTDKRDALANAVRDAHAEGHTWIEIARVIGRNSPQLARYYARLPRRA